MLRLWQKAALQHRGSRAVTTLAFVATLGKVQQQLQSSPDRRTELVRHGRHLFESEVLEDLQAFTPESAGAICHAASQMRISPVKGQPYAATLAAAMDEAAVAAMDADSLARVVHSCLVLRSPMLYDVLFSYIRPLMAQAGSMNAVTVAVLLNAYGRAEVRHPAFYKALCDSAAVTLNDPRISLAHIANVAHALSRVHYSHRPLMLVLRDQAIRMGANAPPLVLVTILDAFAELEFVDAELFDTYERRLLACVGDLQPPLMASLVACLATAGRATPEVMQTLGERIAATAGTFDSASIARTYQAYFDANVLGEDVLGALAERACKVASDFRADEVRQVLNALSSFDLFDGELFPLLAARMISLTNQGGFVSAGDAAGILASFAAVRERHDELVHVASQLVAVGTDSVVDAVTTVNALWACATLNTRNEAQMQLVMHVKRTPSLLQLPAATTRRGERQRKQLEERRALVLKAYSIAVPQ